MLKTLQLKWGFRISLIICCTLLWGLARAQSRTVTGVVKDSKSKEGMPGVNVIIKGTGNGTITDAKGEFSLPVNSDTDILVFSFIGYAKTEVQVGANTQLEVSLAVDVTALEEVVVVGYGEQKKSNVTGAISSVKSQDLQDLPNPRIEDALKGRTSGVMITSSSGQPGSSPTINIRGITSINDSSPLIVVDGVPISGGFDYLNSGDIESIEVLKDAASAAIYGTKAASGVILVTTKKGKAGALRVNVSSYFGTQGPARKMHLLNANEYATLRNESLLADGVNNPSGVEGSTKLFANPAALGNGTDWQSQIFNNNAYIQNSELGISGGTDKSTYFASVGYFKQEGIVAPSISNYKRISIRLNSTHKINNWLSFGQTFSYAYTKSQSGFDGNEYYGKVLGSAINLDPTTPVVVTDPTVLTQSPYPTDPALAAIMVRDGQGNPYGISSLVGQEMVNPLAYIKTQQGNYGWGDKIVGNGYLEIEPIKGLKLRTTAGVDLGIWGGDTYSPLYYLRPNNFNLTKNTFSRNMNKGLNWVWTNTASYTRSFNEHNVSLMIGTEARTLNQAFGVNSTQGTLSGIPQANSFGSASMNWSVPAANTQGGGYESQDYKISSIFARATWDYQGKYMLTGVIRRDGSSHFGANRHYGVFPSLSAGWTPSLESFWPQNNVVSNLKLRVGYGVNGNDNLSPFQYVSLITGMGYYPFGGSTLTGAYDPYAPANPNLHWEQTAQVNYAFDALLLNTLHLSVDVFTKKTKDMLMQVNPPAIVGAENPPWQNIGKMENHGIEITLGYKKQIGQVGLDLRGNLTYVQNKVTNLGDNLFLKYGSIQSSAYEISRKTVGQPVNEFYGFKRLGLFQTEEQVNSYLNKDGQILQPNAKPGDVIWADVNGDGKIDDKDRTFLGNPTPSYLFGFTIGATYKNFDLKIFAQGVAGNKIYRGFRRLDIPTANYQKNALGRWTGPGTSNWYPRMTDADPNGNLSRPSSFYLDDGSYLRVKTIQLGYNFPQALLSKATIQNARVYIGVNNLLTFTHYSGYDPEIGGNLFGQDHGIYPQARSYMVGFNMTF